MLTANLPPHPQSESIIDHALTEEGQTLFLLHRRNRSPLGVRQGPGPLMNEEPLQRRCRCLLALISADRPRRLRRRGTAGH